MRRQTASICRVPPPLYAIDATPRAASDSFDAFPPLYAIDVIVHAQAEDATDEQSCATYRVFRGRFAEDLAEQAPDVYATLRAQEELVVGVLEAQARAKEEKGRAPQKQKKLREALGALRTPSLVSSRGVPCPLDPDVMISGLHAPATSPTMFKSALTPSLVGFTVRQPQTTVAPPATPPPPPPRKRAPSTARLGVLRGFNV